MTPFTGLDFPSKNEGLMHSTRKHLHHCTTKAGKGILLFHTGFPPSTVTYITTKMQKSLSGPTNYFSVSHLGLPRLQLYGRDSLLPSSPLRQYPQLNAKVLHLHCSAEMSCRRSPQWWVIYCCSYDSPILVCSL